MGEAIVKTIGQILESLGMPFWLPLVILAGIFILAVVLMPLNFLFIGLASLKDDPKTGLFFIFISATILTGIWFANDAGWLEWIKEL